MTPQSAADDGLTARMASLGALFEPASVAVIGASDDPSRIGGRPLRYLKRGGFAGAVYPVNPNRDSVQGLKAFPDVSSIPDPVDVALIALPASQVVEAVQACARRSVKAAIIFSAGFTEAGAEGAAHQAAIAVIARESGMRVLGPNCLGAFNSRLGFFGTFGQAFDLGAPDAGPVAIASQSGACGSHLGYLFRERRVGVNYWITTGNEVDVDVSEALLWLAQSPGVEVLGWVALIAPAGTPPRIVERLHAEVEKIMKMPDVVVSYATVGFDVKTGSAQQLQALIKKDLELWGPIVKSTGAKAE